MFGRKGIVLDPALLQRAKEAAAKAGYASVDEFVAHLVQRELDSSDDGAPSDVDEIKKKLEGLGYIS